MWPCPAVHVCCLVSFHFLCDIHSIHSVFIEICHRFDENSTTNTNYPQIVMHSRHHFLHLSFLFTLMPEMHLWSNLEQRRQSSSGCQWWWHGSGSQNVFRHRSGDGVSRFHKCRDGEAPSEKELSSYNKELFRTGDSSALSLGLVLLWF